MGPDANLLAPTPPATSSLAERGRFPGTGGGNGASVIDEPGRTDADDEVECDDQGESPGGADPLTGDRSPESQNADIPAAE